METEEIERAEAREYALRGLRTVALAGLVAIGSTPSLVGGPFVEHAWLPFGLFALLVLAAYRAECYYNDRYGYLAVPDPPRRVVVRRIVVCALPALVLGVAVRLTDLPVNLMAIVGAVILLALFTDLFGFERHHLVVFGTLLAVGAIPVWTGEHANQWGAALTAAAMAISGVLDHRLLVRTYGGPSDPGAASLSARAWSSGTWTE
jgi:hypothetical protein